MKEIDPKEFKVSGKIDIRKLPTSYDLDLKNKKIRKHLKKTRNELGEWQDVLYAHKKYSVLVCLQGMDTSGKDSLIREVFKAFNSAGVHVYSFTGPTLPELQQDYLWRHYVALPARGKFGVFNRTHYENVLVTRVHPEFILNENLPYITSVDDIDEAFWNNRFEQIKNFEKHLSETGTIIFKFFLNISKEEQRQRILRRLQKPSKHWKFSPDDLKERKLWDLYRDYYEDAINRTSTKYAPWYTIPADDKDTTRYLVAKILLEELSKYKDVKEPQLDPKILANLEEYKEQLRKEK